MDINNILNMSSEQELNTLLAKFSEEVIISKVAEYINEDNLSTEDKEKLLAVTAQLLNSSLGDKFAAEKQSMELDGLLRYLFAPNDKGVSNFLKLGDLNVQTAKLAAEDLPGILETERRNMVEKLKDDLDYVDNYEQYQPEAAKDSNRKDDTLDNMYSRYFDKIPDINDILESREKTRKNKMLQNQKETEKNVVKEYNEGTSINSGDLKKQIQALKLLRNKAEQEGNFQQVKDYTKKINSLSYKIRYQTDENDPIYGKGEPADKKQIVIEEAKEGMSNMLSAGKKYQARLQGKVHQFGDTTDDDDYISGKLPPKKIEVLHQQADDINKSLAYVYCALHDYKLYLLQYTKNIGKEEAPDNTQFKEYTQIYEAYAYYSDLFLDTLNTLNKKGYLKGFPISEEFIGRDLGADVTESEEKAQKSRETYAEKVKKDINDIPIDFKYQMKLPKVESFLGKSEGKIIKNTPVSNEALVDEKIQQYEDQLQLGDILSVDEKTLRLKANELKKQKDIAEQNGDTKKVLKLNKDIKTIYQHLDSLAKGKEIPQQTIAPQSQEEKKQINNPDAFFLDDINADDIDVDSIDDAINKTSNFVSLEKAVENLYIRYAASQDDEIKSLLDESEGTQPIESSNVENTSYDEVQDTENTGKTNITNDKKVQKLSDEIKNRIKQFSDKSVLQKVVEFYQKAADGFADIQEKVKSEIKYEDITQAIEYYKQNRQKLRTAAEINIYQYMKYAAEESTDALSLILSSMNTLKNLYREKYRQTNGVGQYVLPILEYLPKLESNMSQESIKGFKRLVGSARDEFKGVDTPERTYYSVIPAKVRAELIDPINDIYYNIEKLQPIVPEKGKSKGDGNKKVIGTDPLSVSAAKIDGLYKESKKLFDSFGMNLGHLGKVDNTYTTILFAHKVFGIKNTFKVEEGEKTWTGFQSNGNSAVPNTVGGVDKLGFYKALKLYPSFLGEVAKMMEKTANEINDTPMKYNISKTIDHGVIGTLPGIYKTNHPNYNYKVRKTK